MIKLIATDLDGTLFYPKKRIKGLCTSNTKFLRSFIKNGGELVIASGRSIGVVKKIETKLQSKVSFIGCNGAFIYKNNIIFDPKPLDNNIVIDIFTQCNNSFPIFNWVLFDENEVMFNYLDEKVDKFSTFASLFNRFRGFYHDPLSFDREQFISHLNNATLYKLNIMFGLTKKAREAAYESYISLKNRYQHQVELAWSDSVVEITALGVNKGKELELYCEKKKIPKNDVLVIGDSGNDITMFNLFPHSFIMSHAKEELKNKANHIVDLVSDLEKYVVDESLLSDDKIIK